MNLRTISPWKHIWAAVLMAVCVLCLLGKSGALLHAGAESQKLYQDSLYYSVTARNEVVIKQARPSVTDVEVPEEIDGCPVTEIGNYAFRSCTRLQRIVIPETVRKIGHMAFSGCTRLTEVSIPDTVTQVGWGILQGTPWLEQQAVDFVVVGDGILLSYNGTAAEVTVPDSVRMIAGGNGGRLFL